jgi:peptidoglycan/LPS O-acetylase OafA/YrhL
VPRPIQQGQRYIPGLDGLRALAVMAVIVYHLNFGWAQGGMLGVGVFFTLSGYLITDLLLGHWYRHGDLGLGQFWLRRARRLLPALFVMLIVVSVYVALFDASQLAAVRRQVVAASLYFSNWSTIAQHGSYFARFAAPLPLDHLWSLAIEEQFYLLWPWLILAGIWLVRTRVGLAVLTIVAAGLSAYVMGHLYRAGYDPTRAYEGTDTRALGLLIGAALAMVWPSRDVRAGTTPALAKALDILGIVGLVTIVLLIARTTPFSSFLYPTGFILLSLATAAVVAAVVNPTSKLGPIVGCRPMRWVGVRSYGIYLWQWPIIVLANPKQLPFSWPRAILEVGATFVIAALSWRFIEEPIRRGGLGRRWRQARSQAGRLRARRQRTALSGATVAAVAVAVIALAGALPVASTGLGSAGATRRLHTVPAPLLVRSTLPHHKRAAAPVKLPTKSSCRSVVYIGDSTSEGEISTDYIPNGRLRLPAQLADVGVQTTIPEISGARSIIETFQGHPNAATVAQQHVAAGFRGCWILALGTNEVDNVHDGGPGYDTRINRMMSIIGGQPVMWIDAITLLPSDNPYSEDGMQRWNHALLNSCSRYPNMRIFDWASYAKPKWFISDGIHYYSPGYVARSHDIAKGLAHAFPQGRPPSASCAVR